MRTTTYAHVYSDDVIRCRQEAHADGSPYFALDVGDSHIFINNADLTRLRNVIDAHLSQNTQQEAA